MSKEPTDNGKNPVKDFEALGFHIMRELERLSQNVNALAEKFDELKEKQYSIRESVSNIKAQAGAFGLIFGFLGSIVIPGFDFVVNYFKK